VAMTATDTVNNGAMGRLGFSFGFGGAPPKAKQAELAAIPAMSMGGNSLFELGNGQGIAGEAPAAGVLLAKRSAPVVLEPAAASPHLERAAKDQALQKRLAELEAEIQRLTNESGSNASSSDRDDDYAQAMLRLEEMKKEKLLLEDALAANSKKLQEQALQIKEQRQMILEQKQRLDALLLKLDGNS